MNRRSFFGILGGAAAAILWPRRRAWVEDEPTIPWGKVEIEPGRFTCACAYNPKTAEVCPLNLP